MACYNVAKSLYCTLKPTQKKDLTSKVIGWGHKSQPFLGQECRCYASCWLLGLAFNRFLAKIKIQPIRGAANGSPVSIYRVGASERARSMEVENTRRCLKTTARIITPLHTTHHCIPHLLAYHTPLHTTHNQKTRYIPAHLARADRYSAFDAHRWYCTGELLLLYLWLLLLSLVVFLKSVSLLKSTIPASTPLYYLIVLLMVLQLLLPLPLQCCELSSHTPFPLEL